MIVFGRIGYWTVAALAVLIALVSMRFLSFNPAALTEVLRPNLLGHPFPFWVHVTLGPIALLLGVWQFLPLTRRHPWHRWAGRLYVVCCLVSALAAFVVAFTTEGGPVAAAGFVSLAVLWFATTLLAYLRVRSRQYAAHRRWMIRSYALTCAAITLRILLPAGTAAGLGFMASYAIAAWGCWTINLLIAELIVRFGTAPADLPRDGATAPRPSHPSAVLPSRDTRTAIGTRRAPAPTSGSP